MLVSRDHCTGCAACIPYCPVGAIHLDAEGTACVDQDSCVECGICYRSRVCPVEALVMPELTWPRVLRAQFSDPVLEHPGTGIVGRGTEEIKTNDVTGRFKPGRVGITVELGRPGTGTSFKDVETVAKALASLGVNFEPMNPVTQLMNDTATGELRRDVLGEKALSMIIEAETAQERLPAVLRALREVPVQTVFSLGVAMRAVPENMAWVRQVCFGLGFRVRPNGKTNVGLGHPSREVR